MSKTAKITLTIIFFMIALVGLAWWWIYNNHEKLISENFDAARTHMRLMNEKHFESFAEDQKLLASLDVFPPSERMSDAGGYLNKRLPWHIQGETSASTELDMTQGQKDHIRSWGDNWSDSPAAVLGLSTAWMSRLLEFDHWNLETDSPLGEWQAKNPYGDLMQAPSIDASALVSWAKLRLQEGLKNKDLKAALVEVRHLAKLLYTTEDFVLAAVAARVLGLEGPLVEKIATTNAKDWTLISTGDEQKIRRALWAYPALIDPMADPSLASRLPGYIGLCQAISEQAPLAMMYRPILEPEIPQFYANITTLLRDHPECRLPHIRKLWNDPKFAETYLEGKDLFEETMPGTPTQNIKDWKSIKNNPKARRMIARILLATAGRNNWSLYEVAEE